LLLIAKVERDLAMSNASDEYKRDLGTGYPSDSISLNFINEFILKKEPLPPIVRGSWQTIQRLKEARKTVKTPEAAPVAT